MANRTDNRYGNRVIRSVAIHPTRPDELASSGADDAIRIWDLPSGQTRLGLEGLLPHQVTGLDQQVARALKQVNRKDDAIEKFIGLAGVQEAERHIGACGIANPPGINPTGP